MCFVVSRESPGNGVPVVLFCVCNRVNNGWLFDHHLCDPALPFCEKVTGGCVTFLPELQKVTCLSVYSFIYLNISLGAYYMLELFCKQSRDIGYCLPGVYKVISGTH